MKKLLLIVFWLVASLTVANAQKKKSVDVDPAKMTPEQRMVQSNARKKNGGASASVSKKVKRARKQDRKSRRMKQPPKNKRIKKQ